jgi:membrane peptidoglycan carboxypeptidase
MMVNAAENEGVKGQLVPGYYVAGKTGTASIPINGGYDPTQTIASFVGVVPASDPQFVVLVKIDRPQDEPWGSLIAKPAFGLIAQELTRYLKVPAEYRATAGLGVPTPSPTPAPTPRRAVATPTRPAAQAPQNPQAPRSPQTAQAAGR